MKRRFGDFRIFVSDKNPRKNVREHKVIKLILFFDKKNKSVIKKIIPPENGGVIFWFIKVFCGKTIRMFPDMDEAGQRAAYSWYCQLKKNGINAEIYSVQQVLRKRGFSEDAATVNDLGDLAKLDWMLYDANYKLEVLNG